MFTQNNSSAQSQILGLYLAQMTVTLYFYDDGDNDFSPAFNGLLFSMNQSLIKGSNHEMLDELLPDLYSCAIQLSYNWEKLITAHALLLSVPSESIESVPHLQRFAKYRDPAIKPELPLQSERMQQIFDQFKDKPDYAESLVVHYQTIWVSLACGCTVTAISTYNLAMTYLPTAFSLTKEEIYAGIGSMALQAGLEALDTGFVAYIRRDIPTDFVDPTPVDLITASLGKLVDAFIANGVTTEPSNGADDRDDRKKAMMDVPGENIFKELVKCTYKVEREWPKAAANVLPTFLGNLPIMARHPLIVIELMPNHLGFAKADYGSDSTETGIPGLKIGKDIFNESCTDIKAENVEVGMVFDFGHYWLIKPTAGKIVLRLVKKETTGG